MTLTKSTKRNHQHGLVKHTVYVHVHVPSQPAPFFYFFDTHPWLLGTKLLLDLKMILIDFIFFIIDVNECLSNTHNCHERAICINTIGSYNCSCEPGLAGDGIRHCNGNILYAFPFIIVHISNTNSLAR